MSPSTFLLICVQACIFQTVLSHCGCGYSALPAPVSYASSNCGCGGGAIINNIPSISSIGCGSIGTSVGIAEVGVAGANYGRAGLVSGSSIGAGAYGGAGTGQCGVTGDVFASGSTSVVGSVPVLGAVEISGYVPASGSVSISGQCGCGCI